MRQSERDQLLAQIDKDYEADMVSARKKRDDARRAVEIVWKLSKSGTLDIVVGDDIKALDNVLKPVTPKLSIAKDSPTLAAREAIQELPEPFSIQELHPLVELKAGRPVNRTSVSSILNKLAADKEIVQVRPGGGRYPAFYRRAVEQDRVPQNAPANANQGKDAENAGDEQTQQVDLL